jgi:hypothetical protein
MNLYPCFDIWEAIKTDNIEYVLKHPEEYNGYYNKKTTLQEAIYYF